MPPNAEFRRHHSFADWRNLVLPASFAKQRIPLAKSGHKSVLIAILKPARWRARSLCVGVLAWRLPSQLAHWRSAAQVRPEHLCSLCLRATSWLAVREDPVLRHCVEHIYIVH